MTARPNLAAEFNVTAYADSAAFAGARYVIITVMQGTKYMLAPNSVYDAFTGYAAGDACSSRDLVLDLAAALTPRGIRLMLYWTGDGPHTDQQAITGLGWPEATVSRSNVPFLFTQRWGAVLQEYAERYGDKVAGWWVDGCYRYFNYTDAKLQPYHDGAASRGEGRRGEGRRGVTCPVPCTLATLPLACSNPRWQQRRPSCPEPGRAAPHLSLQRLGGLHVRREQRPL